MDILIYILIFLSGLTLGGGSAYRYIIHEPKPKAIASKKKTGTEAYKEYRKDRL